MILVHLRLCPQVSMPTSTTHMHRDEQQHSVEEDLQPHRTASEGRKAALISLQVYMSSLSYDTNTLRIVFIMTSMCPVVYLH